MAWQGFALVLAGAFMLALYQVINKKLLSEDAPADCISTVNFLGSGTLLLLGSLLWNPPNIESWFAFPSFIGSGVYNGGFFWPLVATALLNIIILFGSVRALKYGDASLIAPIAAAQPMIVLIPSWLILGEIPGTIGYVGLFLLAVGMYIFSFSEEVYVLNPKTGEKEPWQAPRAIAWMGGQTKYLAPLIMLFKNKGVRIALLVAICGAIAINLDKLTVLLSSSATYPPALVLLFCGLVGLGKTVRTSEWGKVKKEHIGNFILNPLFFAVAILCFWVAFHFGFAAYIGALKRTSAIFVLVLGFLFLNEQKVKERWPGATIMTLGAVLLSL